MNESYIPEQKHNSQFPDFSDNYIPDKELIPFYENAISELKRDYKNTRSVDKKKEINKEIKFFTNGIKYLTKKYAKNSALS